MMISMTIEEFKETYYPNYYWDENSAKELAIEFAKYHVEKALGKAADDADVTVVDYNDDTIPPIPIWGVSSYSILKSYPLDNIK